MLRTFIARPASRRTEVESWLVSDLRSVPQIVILGGFVAICLGVPISLYALSTMDQRKAAREIRRGVEMRGWRYKSRSGGFRIEGSTGAGSALSGVTWVMTSGNSGAGEMRWSCELDLHFPALGGETDVAILPRDGKPLSRVTLSPGREERIAQWSGMLAGAVRFLQDAHEVTSGVAGFDAAYEVRARQPSHAPVDAALAERILHWPAEAVAPHFMVVWRDPFGFNCNARLPGPPNWATVAWLAGVGADCAARLPVAAAAPLPSGWLDRITARIVRS
jgi:hypothetical protein